MKSSLLVVSPQPGFYALIRDGLDSSRFDTYCTSDFSEAILFVRHNNCPTVLLDTELEDVELSVMDIGFALRQVKPDIQFVLVVQAGQEVDTASISPVATLSKPISMPDLSRLLERLAVPVLNRKTMSQPAPEIKAPERVVDEDPALNWLTDVSKAARQLTQLNLESSAQAAFITRHNELWAYAGQLSREAAQELTDSIQRYWDVKGESDLLRFVRLQATEAQHMLYVRKLSDNMSLALVFDAETPFSTIRLQAGKLVKNLFDSSGDEKKQTLAPESNPAVAASQFEPLDNGDNLDIPPISELLGEVPPPTPPKSSQNDILRSSPQTSSAASQTPGVRPGNRQPLAPSGEGNQASFESPPPTRRNNRIRLMPAMDETLAGSSAMFTADARAGALDEIVPDSMQATRKHDARHDPQSLIETRVQTLGEANTEVAHRILIEPPSLYQVNLTYACLLVPRFEHHHLVGDAAARLNEWVSQICVAFGWRLEYISVRPDYLQWIVRVPLAAAAGKVIYTVRKHTSERFFTEFPRYKVDNPSGEFWAPGFIVQGGSQPHPQKQVRDFIRQTRIRQGLR